MLTTQVRLLITPKPQRHRSQSVGHRNSSIHLSFNKPYFSTRWSDSISASMAAVDSLEMDRLVEVGKKVADASGEVIRKYFRQPFDIIDKPDLSPVTIADRDAEESMVSIILENFPSHAIFGEENGWRCKEKSADFIWVLDPIDGTKSFITDHWYH